jgi:hypothetical protein
MIVCHNCTNKCYESRYSAIDEWEWIQENICKLYNPIDFNYFLLDYYELLEST